MAMSLERVLTGIYGLDPLIEGGFPRDSLILLAGNPGTGKTVFSAQFIYHGAERGEAGIYVSFAENRDTFYRYMLSFGLDFKRLEEEGKFKFLDMVMVRAEGISTILEAILGEVHALKARRLVIDSYSAMAQAFKDKVDVRIVLHTILGKIARRAGCTTLLVLETPIGEERIGLGVEEFVADGIIALRWGGTGRLLRELEIVKLRGTRISRPTHLYTLEGGFHVLHPFAPKRPSQPKQWKPLPDSETRFSTGSRGLDEVLGGGYRKGAYVILDVDVNVPLEVIRLIESSVAMNFISQGRGVTFLPSTGEECEELKERLTPYVGEEAFKRYVRVFEEIKRGRDQSAPYISLMRGGMANLEKDAATWLQVQADLRRETKQPILSVIGFDTLEARYGGDLEGLIGEIGVQIAECRARGELVLALTWPGLRVTERALSMVDTHIRMVEKHGCILLYGAKPRTGVYHVGFDVSLGYPNLTLIPIV